MSCNFWTVCCTDLCLTVLEMADNFPKYGGDTSPLSRWFRRPCSKRNGILKMNNLQRRKVCWGSTGSQGRNYFLCGRIPSFLENGYQNVNWLHGRRNHRDSGDVSPPYFGKFSAISKNIRQRSLQQTVQKLQLIMFFDFCKALLTLAMKFLGFSINIILYLSAVSTLNWFYLKLQWPAANF